LLTLRGVVLFLIAGPLLALGAWQPYLEWSGWAWIGIAFVLCILDFQLGAGSTGLRTSAGKKPYPIDAERVHDARLSLAADNAVKINLNSRLPYATPFWVRDEAPDAFPANPQVLQGILPTRRSGAPGWSGVYHVHPNRRGDYRFGRINIRWHGPLGLIARQTRLPAEENVKVYPNLLDIQRYDLLLRNNRLQEMGLRHSRIFGSGTEYERLREYQPDDDFRRIDWKSTARRRRPVTIEYQTERSQTIMAVLDTGRMMQSPVNQTAKLDYAVNAVLLLGYVAASKGDRVGMLSFADQVEHYLAPDQGKGQFYRMLEQLYAVGAQPLEPNYTRALTYLALKQRRRALVIIFTDLTGGFGVNALVAQTALLRRTSLPLVVTISDPDVVQAAGQIPDSSLSAYQRQAARDLLAERRVTLDRLRRQGVLTLDVPANQLSIAVINRYLELKARTIL